MQKKSTLAGLISIYLLACATAQAETLMDIYALAQQNDPQFRAAEARYQAAREARPQAFAALLPQVEGSAAWGTTRERIEGQFFGTTMGVNAISRDTYDANNWGVTLTQTVFRFDQFLELGRADAQVAQAEAERDTAGQDLVMRTAEAYFNVLGAADNLEFAKAEKAAISKQLDQAKLQFDVGMVAVTDVKEAQASYDLAVAQEIEAENAVEINREALRAIIGQEPPGLSQLSSKMILVPPEPQNIDQWVTTAEKQNLPLLAARFQTDATRRNINIQRSGHLPTVDLTMLTDHTFTGGGRAGAREVDNEAFQFNLNVPIFAGGRTSSLTRQAQQNFHQAQEIQEQRRREAVQGSRASYRNVISGISRVAALQQAVVSSGASAESAQAGFEVGTRTSVDVLIALRETYGAQRDYARARYDYILDSLRLKQAAGTLSGPDIEGLNAWLK